MMEYQKLKENLALEFSLSTEIDTEKQKQDIVGNIAEVAVMAACDAWLGSSEEETKDPPCEALVKEFVVSSIKSGTMHEAEAIGKAIYAVVNVMNK